MPVPTTLRIHPHISASEPFVADSVAPVRADKDDLRISGAHRAYCALAHADAMHAVGLVDPGLNAPPHPSLYMTPAQAAARYARPGTAAEKAIGNADGAAFDGLLTEYQTRKQAKVFDLAMPNVAKAMVDGPFRGSRADAAEALADPHSATGRALITARERGLIQAAGGRADADLNAPDGIEANLTALGYMMFWEPLPPQQYEDFFMIDGGWNPGNLNIQLLLMANSGEAKVWQDGGGDDNGVSVGGMTPSTLQIYHFLSTATIGYLQERRGNVLRIDLRNQADKQGRLAHRLVSDRYDFVGGTDVPMPALKTLPIQTLSSGLNIGPTATTTADQLYGILIQLVRWTNDQQSMAVISNTVSMASALITAAKRLRFPSGGDTVWNTLIRDNPGIKFQEIWRLAALDGAGTVTGIAHNTVDPNSAIRAFHTPITALPIWQTLELHMAYVSSAAGVFTAAPMGAVKFTFSNT